MSVSDHDIIEVALNLFAQKGYTSVSTREIATTAGITEMTLFRRFESKKKLFLRCIFHECNEDKYRISLDSIACDDTHEAFREFVKLLVLSFEEHSRITRIVAHCPEVKDQEFRQKAQERLLVAKGDIERFLERVAACHSSALGQSPKKIDIPLLALEILSQATGIFFLKQKLDMPSMAWDKALEDSMMRISETLR